MDAIRFLPTKVHGALDYAVGIFLIALPWIFGFSEIGGAAVWIPVLFGLVLIAYSLITDYEWGLWKKVSMYYHLWVDIVASVVLAFSPWIFGFQDEENKVWMWEVIVGVAVVLVVLVSQNKPGYAMKKTKSSSKSMDTKKEM